MKEDFPNETFEINSFDPNQLVSYYQNKIKEIEAINIELRTAFNIEQLDRYEGALLVLRRYQNIQYHRMISKAQRQAFDHHLKSVDALYGKIMIVMDYKQKFIIGLTRDQVNKEWYQQKQRSCLGSLIL